MDPNEILKQLDFAIDVDDEQDMIEAEFDAGLRTIICTHNLIDGAEKLKEAIEMLDDFADYLRALHRAGYEIECELDEDHLGVGIQPGYVVPEWMKEHTD